MKSLGFFLVFQNLDDKINQQQQPFGKMTLPLRVSTTFNTRLKPTELPLDLQQLLKHNRGVSYISNTCMARQQISLPDHDKLAQLKSKSTIRPFLTKNRKLVSFYRSQKRNEHVVNEDSLPQGFSRILKARSTVIKQNKLQEFYINQGEKQESLIQVESKMFKANLFKPNLPKKKTKLKRSSLFIEKTLQTNESVDLLHNHSRVKRKTATFESKRLSTTTENDSRQMNRDKDKMSEVFSKISARVKGKDRKLKRKVEEKENVEFNLEPWVNSEIEYPYF